MLFELGDFDYEVNPIPTPRVAFGSGQHREVMALRGPQMPQILRRILGEYREYPGPLEYRPEEIWNLSKDYPSRCGFSAFCSKMPRLLPQVIPDIPPAYDEYKFPIKPDARPFGLHIPRKTKEFLTPAPSTYPYEIPMRQYKLSTAFDTKRTYWPAIAIFCTNYNQAKCIFCEKTPVGDYWHKFETNKDICRRCMAIRKDQIRSCATKSNQKHLMRREISGYVLTRYCGFYHNHNGVRAAIPLMSKKLLRFKIRKENYLQRYMD